MTKSHVVAPTAASHVATQPRTARAAIPAVLVMVPQDARGAGVGEVRDRLTQGVQLVPALIPTATMTVITRVKSPAGPMSHTNTQSLVTKSDFCREALEYAIRRRRGDSVYTRLERGRIALPRLTDSGLADRRPAKTPATFRHIAGQASQSSISRRGDLTSRISTSARHRSKRPLGLRNRTENNEVQP